MDGPNDGGSCIGVRKVEGSMNEPWSILRLLIKSGTFVTLASVTVTILFLRPELDTLGPTTSGSQEES